MFDNDLICTESVKGAGTIYTYINTLKGASFFRVYIRGLFKDASSYNLAQYNLISPSLLEKFVKVHKCVNNLWLGL